VCISVHSPVLALRNYFQWSWAQTAERVEGVFELGEDSEQPGSTEHLPAKGAPHCKNTNHICGVPKQNFHCTVPPQPMRLTSACQHESIWMKPFGPRDCRYAWSVGVKKLRL